MKILQVCIDLYDAVDMSSGETVIKQCYILRDLFNIRCLNVCLLVFHILPI